MPTYTSPTFSIDVRREEASVLVLQRIHNPIVHTGGLPATDRVLSTSIPSIFKNKCYNGRGYSFRREARQTEVGHLFEHLILEHLKIAAFNTYGSADFRGETSWDWYTNDVGTFRIEIQCNSVQYRFFKSAFISSIDVLEHIYHAN